MATIGKIRKRSGLLLAIVGGALLLFVLNDLFSPSGGPSRRDNGPVAVVFGEEVTAQDFFAKVEERKEMYMMQYGSELQFSASDNFQINNEVFDQLVKNLILQEEYDKLGLAVSDAELAELLTGRFVHPLIRQLFTNPETGVFDANQVAAFIESLDERSEEERRQWNMYEKMILEERIYTKYVTLVNKGYYIPKAFIDRDNIEKNKKFKTVYTGLQYSSIADSTLTVTDEEIKAYYEKHKHEFVYDEPIASAEFVIFDLKPSATDLAEAKVATDTAYAKFLRTLDADLPVFINANSDVDYIWDSSYLRREVLPVKADTLFNAKPGTFVEPYIDNFVFYMHKLLDRKLLPDSLNAAHILIPWKGAFRADSAVVRTKEEAKAFADSLLAVVRSKDSASFSNLAMQFSSDPSAKQNAGFMGWFPEGAMVSAFNKACLDNPVGANVVVETEYGYHIIRVVDKTKPVSKVKIATIQRTVEPSDATSDSIFNLANEFATLSTDSVAFDKTILDKGYTKRLAEKVTMKDFTLAGISEGREIVRWIFSEETEPGMVSTVFSLDNEDKYVVVLMDNVKQKGQAEFEDVKTLLEPLAKREKKSQMLLEKMNSALSGSNSIEAVAAKLKTEIDTFDVTFSSFSLPGYGPEPEIIGRMTAGQKGVLSKPVAGEMAVYVYTVTEILEAPPIDPKMVMMQKAAFFQSKVNYELFKALERVAEIEDNRILFY